MWWTLVFAVGLFGVDLILVTFFGGIDVNVAGRRIRSTNIEFPVIGLLLTSFILLLVDKKGKQALLMCGSLVLAGLIGEVALTIFDHPLSKPSVDFTTWYQPSNDFGHELVPDLDGFGPLRIPVSINSSGFRDMEHSWDKPEGTIRILGLGDSILFGWGIEFKQTFLKQTERLLEDSTGRAVETINSGVPGWGLNQYYHYLMKVGIRYSPDIIVLAYSPDDLTGSILDSIPPDDQFSPGVVFKGGVLHQSRLYNYLKVLADRVREKNRRASHAYLFQLDPRREEWAKREQHLMTWDGGKEGKEHLAVLRGSLTRLNELANAHQANLIVVFIPDITQVHHPEVQGSNRAVAQVTTEIGIPFLDMTPIFEESKDLQTDYLWPKDAHINVHGHQKIARGLMELLCEPGNDTRLIC